MWNSQIKPQRQSMPNYHQGEPNSWEELLDNNCLEQRLSQISFNGGGYPRGPTRPMAPLAQPVPLLSIMPPTHLLSRHPPPSLMTPPAPTVTARPRFQNQYQTSSNNFVRPRATNQPPPIRPIIDTSVPPPPLPSYQTRPVLLQRPPPPAQVMKGPLTNTDLSSPFPPTGPVIKIVGEDEHRTQYTAPGPKVKILKRPSSTPSNLSSQGEQDGDGVTAKGKSLKQREEEYAQARLRILGSTGVEENAENKSTSK